VGLLDFGDVSRKYHTGRWRHTGRTIQLTVRTKGGVPMFRFEIGPPATRSRIKGAKKEEKKCIAFRIGHDARYRGCAGCVDPKPV
jgi:hypothetical protein